MHRVTCSCSRYFAHRNTRARRGLSKPRLRAVILSDVDAIVVVWHAVMQDLRIVPQDEVPRLPRVIVRELRERSRGRAAPQGRCPPPRSPGRRHPCAGCRGRGPRRRREGDSRASGATRRGMAPGLPHWPPKSRQSYAPTRECTRRRLTACSGGGSIARAARRSTKPVSPRPHAETVWP